MEKISVPAADAGLGPRPASPRTGRVMSTSRLALLETLRAQPQATSLAALVAISSLHPNTVREHMVGLLRDGFVTRERAPVHGRGRPAWLYAATAGSTAGVEYAGLAGALASVIERTSDNPVEDAVAAGRDWGHQLAEELGRPGEGHEAARDQVVALFDRLGFAPEVASEATSDAGEPTRPPAGADDPQNRSEPTRPRADTRQGDGEPTRPLTEVETGETTRETAPAGALDVRLTRCPLLEAAYQSPTVVCNVHLGIVRGAMETYGQDGSGSELHPFSEPGACHLRLAAAPDGDLRGRRSGAKAPQ